MSNLHPVPPPRDHRLDTAVAALAARGDSVAVVRVVEAWLGQGTPTARARYEQARAFFHLRQMDRALNRVREVLEAEPEHTDALLLQAQIYLERGWPVKARKPLQTLREAGAEGLESLWARANAEPVRVDGNAREIEREGNPARMLALAEGFLATGSFLRATGILERLRRMEPDNTRVKDLLWSLAGDFGAGALSAEELVDQLLPPAPRESRGAEPHEEPEHTESLALRASDLESEGTEGVNFPSLFKHAPGRGGAEADDPSEATQSSGLASPEQMGGEGGGLKTLNPSSDPADTQIMLVLRPKEERPAALHRRKAEGGPENLRETLNLRAWQQSMGVDTGSDLAEDDEDNLLEEEDEDVVVMTRGEAPAPTAPAAPTTFSAPIEVVERHATPPAPAAAPEPVAAPKPPPSPPRPPRPAPRPVESPPPQSSSRLLWVGAALFVSLALFAGLVLFGLGLAGGGGNSTIRDDLVRALAQEDYNALLTQEGRLEQRMANGERASEAADVRAALAEARLALWSDYNGDPTRVEKVRAAVAEPDRMDAHRVAVLRAAEALARQDIDGATSALGRERPQDDEERLLFARIAARAGDLTRAMEHFDAITHPDAPRYQLARAEVLADAGRRDEARALVKQVVTAHPDHASARVLELELADASPEDTIAAADQFLLDHGGPGLAPRLGGRLHVLRARAFNQMGLPLQAKDAAGLGLGFDGTNPDLHYLVAGEELGAQRLTAALHELDAVVSARPGDAAAQGAYVLVLLDLDRVDEADAAVTKLEQGNILPNQTPIFRVLVSVWGKQERPTVTLLPPQLETPLGAYAGALMAVQDRVPDVLAQLDAAGSRLAASKDPFERNLRPRLVAMQAVAAGEAGGAAAGDPYAKAALEASPRDPAVHVFLGRYYESTDRKALAAQHFERATQLGAELGLGWYEKGRFYLDARDGFARSGAAWRNLLTLAPSGPRAARAKDMLGIR